MNFFRVITGTSPSRKITFEHFTSRSAGTAVFPAEVPALAGAAGVVQIEIEEATIVMPRTLVCLFGKAGMTAETRVVLRRTAEPLSFFRLYLTRTGAQEYGHAQEVQSNVVESTSHGTPTQRVPLERCRARSRCKFPASSSA